MRRAQDPDKTVLSLRLTPAEGARFWRIMDAAKARNPYIGQSDAVRELLGLKKPDVLTASEIGFFRTGIKEPPTRKTMKIPIRDKVK